MRNSSFPIILTADGSPTLQHPNGETYHSIHGAMTESMHVFIQNGLMAWGQTHATQPCTVLEVGYGTGLNAALAFQYAQQQGITMTYIGLDPTPPSQLGDDFIMALPTEVRDWMTIIQAVPWNQRQAIGQYGVIEKRMKSVLDLYPTLPIDVIFWDAFSPACEPDLWKDEVLRNYIGCLNLGGIWVSYTAKGDIRRSLHSMGLDVRRLPGPPHKHHMLQAIKHD